MANYNSSVNASVSTSTHNTPGRWKLTDLQMSVLFLRSLYATGLSPSEATYELSKLQPRHEAFWMQAHRHTTAGKPLDTYLKGKWPESLVAPMKIAESSGKVNEVLLGMEQTIAQQIETLKATKKLIYPASIAVIGFFVAVFFITVVIPALIGHVRFQKEPFISIFSKWSQGFAKEYGLYILAATGFAITAFVIKWRQNDQLLTAFLRIVDKIPMIGQSTRWLAFAIWAKYISIMLKADLPFIEIFKLSALTLPPHLREISTNLAAQLARGVSLTDAVKPSTDPTDMRHKLPIQITNAFRMTDKAGGGAYQFEIASETLFTPAKYVLGLSIHSATMFAMVVVSFFIATPMVMYLQAITAMTFSGMR